MCRILIVIMIGWVAGINLSAAQSAIGQLENITGQKINRYSGGSSSYDMNAMIGGMFAQSMVNAVFSSGPKYAPVKEVKTQQVFLTTTIVGEKERVEASIRIDKYKRLMGSYKFMKDSGCKYISYKSWRDKDLTPMDSAWIAFQRKMIAERLRNPNDWCSNIQRNLEALDSGKTLVHYFPSKPFKQLEPGDVILVGPTADYLSQKQAELDAWANNNNAYVTHTLTCVKVADGKRMFLDNQAAEGPRMISEEEFLKRYAGRDMSVAQIRQTPWGVAQPLNKEEAENLWNKAKEMARQNADNSKPWATTYGLYGNKDMVCSESSWQLMNATGRYQIPFASNFPLVTGVDFSPATFYNRQQYFLITPLRIGE